LHVHANQVLGPCAWWPLYLVNQAVDLVNQAVDLVPQLVAVAVFVFVFTWWPCLHVHANTWSTRPPTWWPLYLVNQAADLVAAAPGAWSADRGAWTPHQGPG
jgi:hypothetical protein